MGVEPNRGGPPKWMGKIMETPIKMDDLGVPLILETPMKYCHKSSTVNIYIYNYIRIKRII